MSVTGYENLKLELDRIVTNIENSEFLKEAGEFVRDRARENVPIFFGELQSSIETEMVREDGKQCAVVYTDNDHCIFVELGTGPRGASSHAGISPNVAPEYTMHPWYVHESQLSSQAIATYHWKKVKDKNGEVFYRMEGQIAQPYLYPALNQNIDAVIDICHRGIDEVFK